MKINKVFSPILVCLLGTFFIFSAVSQEYLKPAVSTSNNSNNSKADSCGNDLVLVIKKGNLEPACLEASVAEKLLAVNWGNVAPPFSTDILRVGQVLPTNCVGDLVLIIKNTNSKPACVTPETALSLISRGWGIVPNN